MNVVAKNIERPDELMKMPNGNGHRAHERAAHDEHVGVERPVGGASPR